MKLHEQILDVLGEIDEDLLLDLTKKPLRTTAHRKFFRVSAAAAAVVLLAAGGFLLGRKVSQEIHITAPDFPTVIASDIIPRYLLEERSDYLSSSDQILTIAPLTGISLQPQIYTAEHTEDITLTDKMIFADRDGAIWRLVSTSSMPDDPLIRNLRIDLLYANSHRSYGCVLWKADWSTAPAQVSYYQIVPLLSAEETLIRLLNGEAVTTIPDTELPPEGITEDRIGRRTLVYLISEKDELFRIYECFYVRLTDSADGEPRWGLYYVPATDEIID